MKPPFSTACLQNRKWSGGPRSGLYTVACASATRAQAESLLTKLRTQKIIGSGSIVSVPYALRLARNVTPTLIPTQLAELASRGIIAYALLQPDGSATVYTGAFESPTQATPLADSLRALRVAPVLVYRTGRAF